MKKLTALLLALLLALSAAACKQTDTPDETTAASDPAASGETSATVDPTAPTAPAKEGVYIKDSYSVTDEQAMALADQIVATAGSAQLTNGVLSAYYWMSVYNFLNQYGSYVYYYMDPSKALDSQYVQTGITFQHSFLTDALNEWQTYQAMALMAEQDNIPMEDWMQAELDGLQDEMLAAAKEAGYTSVDDMVRDQMGAGCDYDSYFEYSRIFYMGYSYYNHLVNSLHFTQEDIDKYFAENEEDLAENSITKDPDYQYDVRHILIEIEGGTKGEDGKTTYSDADWEACRVKAQNLLDQWLAGEATEESFAALAKTHSTDGGSSANGGLYEDLDSSTNFVEPFKNWYLAQGRQVGDYGLVKSDYGYHIMYLSAIRDVSDVHSMRHILVSIEGGTADEKGNITYSEEDWANCLSKAQDLLDQWLAGEATEDSFGALATEHSADTGSATAGGLYEGLDEDTNFVTAFKEWYMDESRQPGDYGLVQSEYGYHIMYYAGSEASWIYAVRQTLIGNACSQAMEEAVEAFPMEVDYEKIVLGEVALVEDDAE